ncbi:MAG TPA: hypothetical protein VFA40_00250 [Terriglobales bacterium]|jgi:hypothetical protein|nr:hypothetical protein [Terriglobales bacterium]
MIESLRVAHRRAFVMLALVLPAILLIGLGSRRSRTDAGARTADIPATANAVRESGNLWQSHTIHTTLCRRSDRSQEINVVLQSAEGLNEPDLLLYWAANAPEGNVLPEEARLVGAFKTGKAFLIPLNEKRSGYLVLFSSAHKSVFDTARVEKLP